MLLQEKPRSIDKTLDKAPDFEASMAVKQTVPPPTIEETPQNGLAGLKHWRQDMLAALVVALVSVPLSLGIALASGAPPLCGLTSEIIAGLIFPFLGGAYVTISGPAAGLAPVLFAGITTLGHGNMEVGYHLILCVIFMVGIVQLILTWLKAAKFSQMFPQAAIHGMLASIGFLLAAKQIPNFIGCTFHAHDFFAVMAETPSQLFNQCFLNRRNLPAASVSAQRPADARWILEVHPAAAYRRSSWSRTGSALSSRCEIFD
jgi:MFS superfamily sulfate permease-like transporter